MKAPYSALDISRYAINYSNEKGYGISNLKLQKILYFIQAFFLVKTPNNIPCFKEKIDAWDFGPVVPEVYQEYKQFGSTNIPTITYYLDVDYNNIWNSKRKKFDKKIISADDRKRVNTVIDSFSEYSATDLVTLTHMQDPWKNAYVPNKNNEISNDAIRKYFE